MLNTGVALCADKADVSPHIKGYRDTKIHLVELGGPGLKISIWGRESKASKDLSEEVNAKVRE